MRLRTLPCTTAITAFILTLVGCANYSNSAVQISANQTPVQEPLKVQSEDRPSRKSSGDRNAPRGTAGDFDFYLLSLSWSPQHCSTPAGERDRDQCGGTRQYNFVVHGLWPQYDPKGWPQSCGGETNVSRALVNEMLPLMPSPKLIYHEWEKHGTCSGLGQQKYFETVKQARAKVTIPQNYQSPKDAVRTNSAAIKANFIASNSGLTEDMLGVTCSGRFLQEVDVCLTKELGFRSCGRGVRDGCPDELIIQPLR